MSSRFDGFFNAFIGHGMKSRDPFANYIYTPSRMMTHQECADLFTYNGIAQKIIIAPADEAVKEGFTLKNGPDELKDETAAVLSVLEELKWEQRFSTALSWDRLYGGGALLLMANDGAQTLEEPLNINVLKNIEQLIPIEAPNIVAEKTTLYGDARSQLYGLPEYYWVTGYYGGSFRVHESRLLVFRGGILPNAQRREQNGWGAKVYERMYNDLMRYDTSLALALMALSRLSQSIMKLDGLAAKLATDEGERQVVKRTQLIDMVRHMMNTIVVDKDDEYSLENMTITGVTDILDQFQTALSAVTDIPVTVLFGRSPGGLNSTGKADFENYYNMVSRLQRRTLRPKLSRLIDLLSKCSQYNICLPDKYTLEFNPLWQPTEKERADTDYVKAQAKAQDAAAAKTYYDMNALDGQEVRDGLEKQGIYDLDRSLDDVIQNSRLNIEPPQNNEPSNEGNDE
nr:MAG TPA: Portal [Caudoviricetes sp.]